MKMKKTLALILAFAMIMSTMSFTSFAAAQQLPDADENGVITLTEDVTLDAVTVIRDVKLDLAGYTLTLSRELSIKGDCEITNGTIKATEGIDLPDGLIRIGYHRAPEVNSLIINSASVIVENSSVSTGVFYLDDGCAVTLNDVDVTAKGTQEDDIVGVFYRGSGLGGAVVLENGTTITTENVNAVFYRVNADISDSDIICTNNYKPVFRGTEACVSNSDITVNGTLVDGDGDNHPLIQALDAGKIEFVNGTTVVVDAATPIVADGSSIDVLVDETVSIPENDNVQQYAAKIGTQYYVTIADAVKEAVDGDTVTVLPGKYNPVNIGGKNIIFEGSVSEDGTLLTELYGGDPAITGHGFNGTIRNFKITDAWKVFYGEPCGNIVFDNLYVTGAMYGLHPVAYQNGLTWTIQNCYMDLSWANSFGTYKCEPATIIIKNNKFDSTDPYHENYGAPVVNTGSPNTIIENNVFGENTKMQFLTEEAAAGIKVGTNYYADGAENFIVSDNEYEAQPILSWYETEEMDTVSTIAAAKIGTEYYADIQTAIAAAVKGDEIEVYTDIDAAILQNVTSAFSLMSADSIKFTAAKEGLKFIIGDRKINAAPGSYILDGFIVEGHTNWNYNGIQGASISYENCVINKTLTLWNNGSFSFKNCTFYPEADKYALYNYACDSVKIENCVFNCIDKAIKVAPDGVYMNLVMTIDGCTFRASGSDDTKSVMEIDFSMTSGVNSVADIKVTNSTQLGFAKGEVSGEIWWNLETAAGDSIPGVVVTVNGNSSEKLTDTIYVQFEDVTVNEGEKVYDIYMKGNEKDINRLTSTDLTFNFVEDAVNDGDMEYFITANSGVVLTQDDVNKHRYMFSYDGKTAPSASGNAIKIGTVTISGYGKFSFGIDEASTYNIAHATELADNIVTEFVTNGTITDRKGSLVINDNTTFDPAVSVGKIENVEIKVPVRELAVNITFPNTVVNNEVIYQDMTVTIVGGNYTEEIALGTDGEGYSFTRELPYNTTYMVTVEGAGYRTARYAVTLNDNKTLNFWNNVMDNALEVEEDKATSATTKNFLAGDIVKDNNINIYDLSAVVAYFGTEGLSKDYKPEYAKYDLNRDGVIDSKDVAYVLVSWGE